jgi:hypothetical protein
MGFGSFVSGVGHTIEHGAESLGKGAYSGIKGVVSDPSKLSPQAVLNQTKGLIASLMGKEKPAPEEAVITAKSSEQIALQYLADAVKNKRLMTNEQSTFVAKEAKTSAEVAKYVPVYIRYMQQLGLLPMPQRPAPGQQYQQPQYDPQTHQYVYQPQVQSSSSGISKNQMLMIGGGVTAVLLLLIVLKRK